MIAIFRPLHGDRDTGICKGNEKTIGIQIDGTQDTYAYEQNEMRPCSVFAFEGRSLYTHLDRSTFV